MSTEVYEKLIKDSDLLNKEEFDLMLQEHCNRYYNNSTEQNSDERFQVIPDKIYDQLVDKYESRFGPYTRVGAKPRELRSQIPPTSSSGVAPRASMMPDTTLLSTPSLSSTSSSSSSCKPAGFGLGAVSAQGTPPIFKFKVASPVKQKTKDVDEDSDQDLAQDEEQFDKEKKRSEETLVGLREEFKVLKYMGSLKKAKDDEKLRIFLSKYDGEKIISDKIDGVSAGTDGKRLWTRGDGVTGVLITQFMPYLGIPTLPPGCLVRGEIVMPKSIFELRYKSSKANPRNTVSGIVNSKTPTVQEAKDLRFIAYEFVPDMSKPNHCLPQGEQFKQLEKLGFTTPAWEVIKASQILTTESKEEKKDRVGKTIKKKGKKNEDEIDDEDITPAISVRYLSTLLVRRRSEAIYDMDGLVIAENIAVELVDGQDPKHMIAFKGEDEVVRTTVEKVEWKISKHGTLRPLVYVKPVKISGINITKVTGHNAKRIIDSKIGPGAVIEIIRSGEVIPTIVGVVKPATKLDMPKCEYEWAKIKRTKLARTDKEEEMKKLGAVLEPPYWVWYETSDVHLAPKNISDNREVKLRKIVDFFKKMEAKHAGPATLEKLFDAGYDTLNKIFDADVDDLAGSVEGMKQKSSQRFVDAVHGCITNASLAKVAAAAGIFGDGVGEKKLEKIFTTYPDILEASDKIPQSKLIEMIQSVEGIKTMAAQIASSIKKLKEWIAEHPQITFMSCETTADSKEEEEDEEDDDEEEDDMDEEESKEKKKVKSEAPIKKAKIENKKLQGKTVCFTGGGTHESSLKNLVVRLGGKVTTSVSKKTSYLVTGKKPGPKKLEKAEEYSVEIVDVEKFLLTFKSS